jgi:hypothetical protein
LRQRAVIFKRGAAPSRLLLELKQEPTRNPLYESSSKFQNPLTSDRRGMRIYSAYMKVVGMYYVFSLVKEERELWRQYRQIQKVSREFYLKTF